MVSGYPVGVGLDLLGLVTYLACDFEGLPTFGYWVTHFILLLISSSRSGLNAELQPAPNAGDTLLKGFV